MTQVCAIYVRYSDDTQRATSIDDQIRRCKELAARHNLSYETARIYQDIAITGKAEGESKREGFRDLLDDWDRGAFDVLLVDEFSRLSRDVLTQAQIIRRLESNQRVRMLSANGVDTLNGNWQLLVGLEGIVSQQASRDTKHRVVRGMIGQLERGYMIATPAYGYSLKREFDAAGNRRGTQWEIEETTAVIVRDIFERRAHGESMHAIARSLNDRGVPTRRKGRNADGGYWRPSSIRNLLSNTIYKGLFVWNGSNSARARAKKSGYEIEEKHYLRPQLRLVSDELWGRCNNKTISRSGYGGGRHILAGLVQCGHCDSVLAVTGKSRCRSLYCPRCTVAKNVAGEEDRLTGTVAVAGLQQLLIHAARKFLNDRALNAFKDRLREQLLGDIHDKLNVAKMELARLEGAQERLSRLLAFNESEDPILIERYNEARDRAQKQREAVTALIVGVEAIDKDAIAAQLEVADPLQVLDGLFDSDLPPERVRSVLARLFPAVIFESKRSRYQSVFSIRFAPGAAVAMVSETAVVDEEEQEMRFLLRYWAGKSAKWTVECLCCNSLQSSTSTNAQIKPPFAGSLVVTDCHANA